MREEIRLGNEALARNDFETAKRCFQQLLAMGGTPTQERIAANRLREIQERQEAPLAPSMVKPGSRRKAPRVEEHMVKPDSRRKAPRVKEEHDETTIHKFIRPPDKPIVVIKKH